MKKRILSLLQMAVMLFTMMFTQEPITVYATPPPMDAYVSTYEAFIAAVANTDITTIYITGDFSLEGDVTINRSVTIGTGSANTINTGSYSLVIGGGSVSLDGSLSLTGTSTTVEVVSGGAISLPASYTGTISTTGIGGKALYAVGGTAAVNIAGGTISAGTNSNSALCVGNTHSVYVSGGTIISSGRACGVYMEQGGLGTINIYITEDEPNINTIYYYWNPSDAPEVAGDYPVLTSLPAPVSMCIGEVMPLDFESLFGENSGISSIIPADFATGLNFSHIDLTLSPATTGVYSMLLRLKGGVNVTIPVTVTNAFAGGDGTESDPYQIETAEQLNRVRNFIGPAYKDTYFQLTAPIDLSSYTNWEPIGDVAKPFCGHFYGCSYDNNTESYVFYPISNLTINRPDEDYVGLFGYCASAEIGGVAIRNADVTGNNATGVLVGQSVGYIGAVLNEADIWYCSSTGSVTSNYGRIGGLVGMASETQINQSYSTVSVTGTNTTAGGLVGFLKGSDIRSCYATGSVSSAGEGNYAGGLVGEIFDSTGHIYTSYAAGHVTGEDETGGLIGNNNSGYVSLSFFNIGNASSSDIYHTKGTGLKTSQMLYESSYFDDWDFPSSYSSSYTWMIDSDVSYPYLRYNEQTPHPTPPSATSVEIALIPDSSFTYDTSTKTMTVNYNTHIGAFSVENITPADGLPILSSSDSNVVDVYWDGSGGITIYAISAGTATISLKSFDGTPLESITVIVEPIPIMVTGDFEVEDKEYDGSTNADIAATSTLSLDPFSFVGNDMANLTANFVATFSDPDVDQDKTISLNDSYLTGSAADNYVLDFSDVPEVTGSITPKELTIGGSFTAQGKAYDSSTNAAIASNDLTLNGRIGSDDVTLVPDLAFDTPDIGTGKTVYLTAGTLTGTKAGNYTLSITGAPTYTSGVITDKLVTLGNSFTVNNKEYSGDKAATIATNNLMLVGLNPGDDVYIASVTAEFDNAAAGNGKTVRITGITLAGANAGSYAVSLTGAPTGTANITAKPLTITGSFTVIDRQYNGTVNVEIDTNALVLNGIIGSDTVSLNASAAFDDANVGIEKTVTLTGSSLTGVYAANYAIDLTGAPTATANITKATGLQAPATPTLQSKTSTSVTLTPNAEHEFSKDNGATWQISNVFTGLTPSTEYSFITRINENSNYEASLASVTLTVTTNASSSSGGGSTGGGSTPAPSTPTQKISQVNVILDQAKMEKEIQKALKEGQNTIQIIVDESENDKADKIEVSIDKDAVRKLSDSEVALEIKTEGVSIQMPKETVQAISEDEKDLFFRITPIDNEDEKTAAAENAITAKVVQTATGGGEVVALGTPMMIETNYQGYSTKLVFSLKDITIPEDETQRALFLSGLGVYINHSDKEQEFKRGTIIYDSDGNPVGIEIEISKFSTFTMISIINEAPVASDLIIIGKAKYGKKITASYNYNDKEQDEEGKSLISWYRTDSKKGKNKKLVSEGKLKYKIEKADQGKYLIVEITPVASTGEFTGSTVSAYVKVAANKAPKAVSKKITGKTVVGSKLTAKYTYQDTESDKEGKTTIQWYRADSADGAKKQKIKNANKRTYTLTKADLGKYIIVEIKPVAKTGSKTGTKTTVATKTVIKLK